MTTTELDIQVASALRPLPSDEDLQRWVEAALAGRGSGELTLRIVDEDEISDLNQRYRHKDGPTNVLSFPFEAPPGLSLDLLGDIVVCAPVVVREADAQGKTPEAHWCHLVVHGVLHLLGYDHLQPSEASVMEGLEIEILASLGYPDPYGDVNDNERRPVRCE